MKKAIVNLKHLALLFTVGMMALFSSCTHDESWSGPSAGNDEISFSFELPNAMVVRTRSTATPPENAIKGLSMLVFKTGVDELLSVVPCTALNPVADTDQKEWTFKAKLTKGETYDLLLVANASAKVATLQKDATRAEIISALEIENTAKWNISGSAEANCIPMWGEMLNQSITDTYSPSTGRVKFTLTRMLARINVALASGVEDDFELTEIYYFNYHTKGFVIPSTDGGGETVYPADGLQLGATHTTMGYTATDKIYVFEAMHQATYGNTNETTGKSWVDNPCLVIGGEYDGKTTYYRLDFIGKDESSNDKWLSVQRNHSYNFTITRVSGEGYGRVEDAFNSAPINMEVEVDEWDDGEIGEVVIDGPYKFGVNNKVFELLIDGLAKDEESNKLIISTTYKNWMAEFSKEADRVVALDKDGDNEDWVGFGDGKDQSDAGDEGKTERYIYYKKNSTQFLRTAYIHLTSGKMKIVVELKQSVRGNNVLEIVDENGQSLNGRTISFYESGTVVKHELRSFTLRWSPNGEKDGEAINPVSVEIVPLDKNNSKTWTYDTGDGGMSETDLKNPGTTGTQTFRVRPVPFATNEETNSLAQRGVMLIYSIGEGDEMQTAVVSLAQAKFNSMTVDHKDSYLFGENIYTINVKSTYDWKITRIDATQGGATTDPDNLFDNSYDPQDGIKLVSGYEGVADSENGIDLKFKLQSDILTPAGEISIQFEDKNNSSRYKIITFKVSGEVIFTSHGGWAGSNIYWDNTNKRLTFDLEPGTNNENALKQGVYFGWGSLVGLSPGGVDILWNIAENYTFMPNEWLSKTVEGWAGGETGMSAMKNVIIGYSNYPFIARTDDINDKKRHYLYEVHDPQSGIGDICKYISDNGYAPDGGKWRMPTAVEMDAFTFTLVGTDTPTQVAVASLDVYGTTKLTESYYKSGEVVLPLSSFRNQNMTVFSKHVGTVGTYISASPYSYYRSYMLYISPSLGNSYTSYTAYRGAFPIRCVREK